jgi:hypothetical protein
MMNIELRDSGIERRIAIGLIVDAALLSRIAPHWDGERFRSKYANLIGNWCLHYYDKYGKAPGKAIEGLFESWASRTQDQDNRDLVEKFLATLSDDYDAMAKESNSEGLCDLAANYFVQVQIERLAEAIQGDAASGHLDQAIQRINAFEKLNLGVGAGIDVLQDEDACRRAFEDKREPLIIYPGALGDFLNVDDVLERDCFVAFQGAKKRGKTWALLDLAWRAMEQRRRVAFFEVGDMSQNQILRRFYIRAARRPLRAIEVKYPIGLAREDDAPLVNFEKRRFDTRLDWQAAREACLHVMKSKVRSNQSYLKLACYPNSTISVTGIKDALKGWQRQGWEADVVCIDYADILAPLNRESFRIEQIDDTWKALRGLSQELHCLVVTATQANAHAHKAKSQGMEHFSGSHLKIAHANAVIGLNQTAEEKELGVMRWGWVALREGEALDGRECLVAGCLPIGNPVIRSLL